MAKKTSGKQFTGLMDCQARFVNVKALRDLPGQSKTHLSNPKTNKKKSWMKKKARCGDNTAITIKKKRVMAELLPISQP